MSARVLIGDVRRRLKQMPDESVHMVVTSPPYYGLRNYDVEGQLGLEDSPEEYIANMVQVFREVRRVLRSDGVIFVNMGDSYTSGDRATYRSGASDNKGQQVQDDMPRPKTPLGLKPKDLIGMPWMLAFALRADGWYLRQDIIWHKPNPMPESVQDRCTKAHEYIFLFSKSEEYFFDAEAIKEKCSTNSHTRGGGVNPKAKKAGQHSRMRVDRDPRHMKDGVPRKDLNAHAGHPIQSGLARTVNHNPRSKQNESFSAAANEIVEMRNKRDVWTMATAPFKEAHFATFPPALPRTCIKAGTSAKGCCSVCGRPFERIVEKYTTNESNSAQAGNLKTVGKMSGGDQVREDHDIRNGPVVHSRTIGWEEDCCRLFGGHAVPCTVLDPFSGAGTSGMVAEELGRNYIGLELKLEYAMLTLKRKGMEQTEIVQ